MLHLSSVWRNAICENQNTNFMDFAKTIIVGNEHIALMDHSGGYMYRVQHLNTVFGPERSSGFDDIAGHFPHSQIRAGSNDPTVRVCDIRTTSGERLDEQFTQHE